MRTSAIALTTLGPCLIGLSSPANHPCHALRRLPQSPRETSVCEKVRSYAGQQPWASLAMRKLLQRRPHRFHTQGQRTQRFQASQTAAPACLH